MSNSIGNLKNSGLKGNNWPWQYKVLLGLDKIAASIVTGGKEYEAELVNISCSGPVPPAGDIVRLEIRIFDTVTGGFTSVQYYEPGSTTPDPADYSGCTITYITGGGGATEATQLLVEANTASVATALTSSSTTGAGTIPAGSKAATIFIDGSGGSINSVVRPDGWSQSFEFNNDTLPDIDYNGNGSATVYVDILT
jgi:hypothetical protein